MKQDGQARTEHQDILQNAKELLSSLAVAHSRAISEARQAAESRLLPSLTKLQEELVEVRGQHETLQRRFEALEGDHKQLSTLAETFRIKNAELLAEIEDANAAVQHAHCQKEEKSAECKAVSEKLQIALGYRRVCASLQTELGVKEAENSNLLARLNRQNNNGSASLQGIQHLETELSLYVKQVADLEAEKREWQKHREILKDAYKKERAERRKLEDAHLARLKGEGEPATRRQYRDDQVSPSEAGHACVNSAADPSMLTLGSRLNPTPTAAAESPARRKARPEDPGAEESQRREVQSSHWEDPPQGDLPRHFPRSGRSERQSKFPSGSEISGPSSQGLAPLTSDPPDRAGNMLRSSVGGQISAIQTSNGTPPRPIGPDLCSSEPVGCADVKCSSAEGEHPPIGGAVPYNSHQTDSLVEDLLEDRLVGIRGRRGSQEEGTTKPTRNLETHRERLEASGSAQYPVTEDPSAINPSAVDLSCLVSPEKTAWWEVGVAQIEISTGSKPPGSEGPKRKKTRLLERGDSGLTQHMGEERSPADHDGASQRGRQGAESGLEDMGMRHQVKGKLGGKKRKSSDLDLPKQSANPSTYPEPARKLLWHENEPGLPYIKQKPKDAQEQGGKAENRSSTCRSPAGLSPHNVVDRHKAPNWEDCAEPKADLSRAHKLTISAQVLESSSLASKASYQASEPKTAPGSKHIVEHRTGAEVFQTHKRFQCKKAGQKTERGVLESLHLLDMSQGLNKEARPAGSAGQKAKRLPAIVERKTPATGKSVDSTPQPAQGFKYREVVRKKAEREELQGFGCTECEGFYRAVQSWGVANCELPICGHVKDVTAASKGGVNSCNITQMRQQGSRHRYRFEPPSTPEGFWDMGFGDSQDSR